MTRRFKHLSYEERCEIEDMLNNGSKIQHIANTLNRDPKTIREEVKRNRTRTVSGCFNSRQVNCDLYRQKICKQQGICGQACTQKYNDYCWQCDQCEYHCQARVEFCCPTWKTSPYCCNSCKERRTCSSPMQFKYRARQAQAQADQLKSEARKGTALTEAELSHMTQVIQAGLDKKQSFYHIATANADDMYCSPRHTYRLKDQGLLEISNLDMPRTVQRKPRRKRKAGHKVDRKCRMNRTYQDFQAYLEDHPGTFHVQMDTVEGRQTDLKCFLSLSWPHLQLSLFFLMERQTAQCVEEILTYLHDRLGSQMFQALFPGILTDNGSEFSNPQAIEALGTRLFYCDPGASHQKGHVENQNGLLRRILPKNKSFEKLQFEDSFLINAHLNNCFKLSLNGKTPLQMLRDLFGQEVIEALHLYDVDPNDVNLGPELLRGEDSETSCG